MSIRSYNKDHLKEHASVSLADSIRLDAPKSDDPLVFWTHHEKHPCEVNLHPLAEGQEKGNKGRFIAFSGRPELIIQLAPAIEEALLYAATTTVYGYLNTLRDWWRLLDAVEAAAAKTGQDMARVEDVRLLTNMHVEFAHRIGMLNRTFSRFRSLVDITSLALGSRQTYWESPEDPDTPKHIPPLAQRNALRFEVRRICRNVLERWAQSDRLSHIDKKPTEPQEANLWLNVRHMHNIQRKTGKVLPTSLELCDGVDRGTLWGRGIQIGTSRESVFPGHRDAEAVWHQCLLNTGWNSSTLTSLDVTKRFLFNHYKDDHEDPHRRFVLSAEAYELVGEKERAGGKEQFVTGQWKSLDGPGYLIKTYLNRVEPLRSILKQQLAQERLTYEQMKDGDYKTLAAQFGKINTLEQGVRSVWLYVDGKGHVGWISNQLRSGMGQKKKEFYLGKVVRLLNAQRATERAKANALRSASNLRLTAINARRTLRGRKNFPLYAQLAPLPPIPHVAAKDFRVWFADYVYRSGNGNMLHVKRALNHARLSTSSGYVDTTILNQEASDAARRFLNILIGELEAGRVDLTILAHLYRYGEVTPEQEETLAQLRTLPKSRMNVACKDAHHPPAHLKATANEICDVQRCLLCLEHAVLLPESLDGIAMRVEELRALRCFLPIETWIEERYEIEQKNNFLALRKFDLNQGLEACKKWAMAIASGEHYVPGLPLPSSTALLEMLV